MTKKEVLVWIKDGEKTIDVRKGNPSRGDVAVFMSGPVILRLPIVKKEKGLLTHIIRSDNYTAVIPWAKTRKEALAYLQALYNTDKGIFTAYYISQEAI